MHPVFYAKIFGHGRANKATTTSRIIFIRPGVESITHSPKHVIQELFWIGFQISARGVSKHDVWNLVHRSKVVALVADNVVVGAAWVLFVKDVHG